MWGFLLLTFSSLESDLLKNLKVILRLVPSINIVGSY
jgi:hypothetical protein